MQPRVISIKDPKIPCWRLMEQVQHLCKYLKCAAKGASFLNNGEREVRQHKLFKLQGELVVPFG
ncbi:hypothetical protein BEI59_37150 [Eisenbergiella tayi]|uniref:Uncharacterized protein n=1 Tax=Eisenbergiella tayi TaxID=1432052 RepID=A0A1E3U4R5_9FIRM|nr:hypothetical protein BEI59_37150 [Eisenbergiella tayi]RJW30137.1 hypothetical protein DXC97_33970 [Lachnospiraceae bacterium TF09-5]